MFYVMIRFEVQILVGVDWFSAHGFLFDLFYLEHIMFTG